MLPYSAESLFASVARYDAMLWPLPVLALALCLAAILLTLRPMRGSNPAIALLLAAAWLSAGIGWHLWYFARLDFAAPLYGALFVLQGLLLVWIAVRGGPAFRFGREPVGWIGLGCATLALAWPLVDLLAGQDWRAARIAGLAPAPTTVLTFGLLLLVDGRTPLHLAIVPLLWTLIAGATAWILWIPQDLALPAVGVGGLVLIIRGNRIKRRNLPADGRRIRWAREKSW